MGLHLAVQGAILDPRYCTTDARCLLQAFSMDVDVARLVHMSNKVMPEFPQSFLLHPVKHTYRLQAHRAKQKYRTVRFKAEPFYERNRRRTFCAPRHHSSCCGKASPHARKRKTSDPSWAPACPAADLATMLPRDGLLSSSVTFVQFAFGSVCRSQGTEMTGALPDMAAQNCNCKCLLAIALKTDQATYKKAPILDEQNLLETT